MHELLPSIIDQFARSGGGGSSGSGGGGGGEVIMLIGYVPSYYLGKLVKKLFPRKTELIISASFATLVSIVLLVIAFSSGSFSLGYLLVLVVVGVWLGWSAAFFGVMDKIKQRSQKAKAAVQMAAQKDDAWSEARLLDHAKKVFVQYQTDWSSGNTQNLLQYCTPYYATHASLMMRCLYELNRQNVLSNLQIQDAIITDAHDDADNTKDTFTVAFSAVANDVLIDKATNQSLFTDSSSFIEYWTFQRSDSTWLLNRIVQNTADSSAAYNGFSDIAARNNMFYSLDMGWLFMPKNGLLFRNGKFGKSDINNHVIGLYNNSLTQLYTYSDNVSNDPNIYAVAQINLPKSYGGILVRPKGNIFQRGIFDGVPNNYTKYTFEWPDFNDRYEVFATDADRLASFELINPGFMAYLYDNDPKAVLEVADNTVYIYKKVQYASPQDYEIFMTILMKSFKELQL